MEENRPISGGSGPDVDGRSPGRGHGWRWAWPAFAGAILPAAGLVFLPLPAIFPSHAQEWEWPEGFELYDNRRLWDDEHRLTWCDRYENEPVFRKSKIRQDTLGEELRVFNDRMRLWCENNYTEEQREKDEQERKEAARRKKAHCASTTYQRYGFSGPRVSFSRSSQTVNEGGSIIVNIRSFPNICAAINVKYSISAGTATAGSDFTPVSGTVEMVETVDMVGLRVNTIDDSIADGDKTVILTLLPDADYELGTRQKSGERTTMTLTIVDDDMPIVSFASAGRTVSEAAGTVNVRMDIAPAPTSAMTVLYAINADPANFGTARVGSDLTAIGCRPLTARQCDETDIYFVSVPAGATSVTIPVTIIDDSAGEGHETLVLTLLGYTGIDGGHLWNRGGRVDHTLTIADNDTPQISFASAGQTVNEAAGTVNARMDIAPAPTSAMTLSYTVGGGTANLFTDPWGERDFRMLHPVSVPPGVTTMNIVNNYRVANLRMRSVSVPAGATRVTIPMTIIDDSVIESNETMVLTLLPGTGYNLDANRSGQKHTLTIADNDTPLPTVNITSAAGGDEGDDVTFIITATPAPTTALPVSVTVTAVGDYGISGGARTVSIPTSGSFTLTLPTTDDTVDEENGSVTLTVEAGAGYSVGALSSQTASITNDDLPTQRLTEPPQPTISITGGSAVTEGGDVVFTLTADPVPAANLAVTVSVTESGNVASSGATGARTVTIGTGGTVDFTVSTEDDEVDEADGSIAATVTAGTGYTVGSVATASVTVADNDVPTVSITGGSSVTEGGDATFTLTASPAPAANLPVTVSVTESGNVASSGATGTRTVTIGTSGTVDFTVATEDDAVDEADGSIAATITTGTGYTVGSAATASVTVRDDDVPTVNITSAAGGSEGADVTFVITANPAPAAALPVSVTVTTVGEYGISAGSRTVTIPTSGSVTLRLSTTDDAVDEEDGSVTLTVNAGEGYTVGALSSQSASITDDDVTTQQQQRDSDNPYTALITRVRGYVGETFNGEEHVKRWQRVLKALGEKDAAFTALTPMTATEAQTYADRGWTRWDEVVTALTALEAAAQPPAQPPVQPLVQPPQNICERLDALHNAGTVCNLSGKGIKSLKAGDFNGLSKVRILHLHNNALTTLPEGVFSGLSNLRHLWLYKNNLTSLPEDIFSGLSNLRTVWLQRNNLTSFPEDIFDGLSDLRSIHCGDGYCWDGLSIYLAGNNLTCFPRKVPQGVALFSDKLLSLCPVAVSITGGSAVTEGEDVVFTLTADPAPAANLPVRVSVTESGNVATSGATGTRTVTIGTGGTVDFTVSTEDDDADEADGSIAATVTAGTGYTVGSVATASVTVRDDDVPTISITGGSAVTEGGDVTFTLTASPAPAASLPVTVSVSESGDVASSGATGTRTVSIGTGGTVDFTVSTEDDDVDEADGSIAATVTAGTGYTVGSVATASVTVRDNDVPTISITGGSAVTEGGDVTFTLTATPSPAANLAVRVSVTESGNVASSGATGTRTVTIGPGGTVDFTVATEDDDVDEADGSIAATVTAGMGYTVGSVATASVTVRDDDVPTVNITSAAGGNEGADVTFILTATPAPAAALPVSVTVTAAGDYGISAGPQTVSIPTSGSFTLRLPTTDDTVDEDDGSVTLTLESGAGYSVGALSSQTVSITDDDVATQQQQEEEDTNPYAAYGDLIVRVRGYAGETSEGTEHVKRWQRVLKSLGEKDAAFTALTAMTPTEAKTYADRGWTRWEEVVTALTALEAAGALPSVPGKPMLSVSDASGEEGEMLEFTISLSRPHDKRLHVVVRTRESSPVSAVKGTSGDFYVDRGVAYREPIHVGFNPGETEQPVYVNTVNDAHDDDGETFELYIERLYYPVVGVADDDVGIADGVGVGTISNSDPIPGAWLGRFGRTVSQQVVDAVRGRFKAAPDVAHGGLDLTVAGEHLSSVPLEENEGALRKLLGFESVSGEQLVAASSFSFTPEVAARDGGAGGAGQLSVWGQGVISSFSGREDALSLSGDVTTALLGAEWSRGRWQAGAALSHSWGSGDYAGGGDNDADGSISATLLGLFPYGRYALTPRLDLWAIGGYGWGNLTLKPQRDGAEELNTTTNLVMGAVGLEGVVLDGGAAGLSLSTTADALVVETTSAEVKGLKGSEATISRLRLGLEATRPIPLDGGASLLPSLEVGIRQDGGDAETGYGVEVGAGVVWKDPQRGIRGEAQGRTLVTHTEEEFREQGLALSFAWEPSPDKRGPSLSMGHTMGAAASGGMAALLQPVVLEGLAAPGGSGQQFEAEFAYGFPAFNDRLTLTPSVAAAFSEDSRTYGLLWSLAPYSAQGQGEPWEIALETERQEYRSAASPTEHSLKLRFSLLF